MERYRRIKTIKEVVHRYFSEHLVAADDDDVRLVNKQQWTEVVGEHVAQHSRPLYTENGVLIIETEHGNMESLPAAK